MRPDDVGSLPTLDRGSHGRAAAPVRIVHLGLGNFARAHQFWYTEHAPDAAEWGVAAFTGRRPDAALELSPQDGLYTLVTRSEDSDRFEVISTVTAVHPSAEHDRFLGYLADPAVAIVTTTVTEAGYVRGPDGGLDFADARVVADLRAVAADPRAPLETIPVRLAAGLESRRRAGAGAITVLPCDNLTHNGAVFARVVTDAAEQMDPALAAWIRANVSWATCMVDRITPATSERDIQDVAVAGGYLDRSPVPTEPFSEWIITGDFPAGRPRWEDAGALLVDDVEPFEQRKLRMLNGAHSLMAYGASLRGHATVADAITDPVVAAWVEQWWDAAARHLTVPTDDYRAALRARFANPRIQHRLGQIALDGSQKLPVRILPVVRAELEAGLLDDGALRPVAAWVRHLREGDVRDDGVPAGLTAGSELRASVRAALGHLDPGLASIDAVVDAITRLTGELTD